ncbi:MAG TPA: CapA family protein [Candidatus Moranbacteria bacterium]|nr:CapA family protein [Candidatus Moranbacteria bacterium]
MKKSPAILVATFYPIKFLGNKMKRLFFIISAVVLVVVAVMLSFYYLKASNAKTLPEAPVMSSSEKNKENFTVSTPKEKIKILFVGDMMFDRWIREVSDKRGADFIFQKTSGLLQSEDLVVGNLEGPITAQPSVSLGSEIGARENYIFTFPPAMAAKLYDENIRLVNIGNNHILNFGKDGLEETKKYLLEAKINFFGEAGDEYKRFFIKEVKGIRIAFVNYNKFSDNGEQKALDDLQEAKKLQPDFVVVYTHWGTEYVNSPSESIREQAHKFIDNGTDLIIGSHPHVVQTKEEYKGKKIYYSLGNFVFDQYFDQDTQKGLVVQMEIDSKTEPVFREFNVEMKNSGQTVLN